MAIFQFYHFNNRKIRIVKYQRRMGKNAKEKIRFRDVCCTLLIRMARFQFHHFNNRKIRIVRYQRKMRKIAK